jgi:hypothetical protein
MTQQDGVRGEAQKRFDVSRRSSLQFLLYGIQVAKMEANSPGMGMTRKQRAAKVRRAEEQFNELQEAFDRLGSLKNGAKT